MALRKDVQKIEEQRQKGKVDVYRVGNELVGVPWEYTYTPAQQAPSIPAQIVAYERDLAQKQNASDYSQIDTWDYQPPAKTIKPPGITVPEATVPNALLVNQQKKPSLIPSMNGIGILGSLALTQANLFKQVEYNQINELLERQKATLDAAEKAWKEAPETNIYSRGQAAETIKSTLEAQYLKAKADYETSQKQAANIKAQRAKDDPGDRAKYIKDARSAQNAMSEIDIQRDDIQMRMATATAKQRALMQGQLQQLTAEKAQLKQYVLDNGGRVEVYEKANRLEAELGAGYAQEYMDTALRDESKENPIEKAINDAVELKYELFFAGRDAMAKPDFDDVVRMAYKDPQNPLAQFEYMEAHNRLMADTDGSGFRQMDNTKRRIFQYMWATGGGQAAYGYMDTIREYDQARENAAEMVAKAMEAQKAAQAAAFTDPRFERLPDPSTINAMERNPNGLTEKQIDHVREQLINLDKTDSKIQNAVGKSLQAAIALAGNTYSGFLTGADLIGGILQGDTQNVNYSNAGKVFSAASGAAMQGLTDDMSQAGAFLTQTAISIAGNIVNRISFGPAGLIMMSVNAGGLSANEAAQNGASAVQALATGIAKGALEYGTEKISWKNLDKVLETQPDTIKEILRMTGAQIVTEGGEEAVSEFGGMLIDMLILGDEAEIIKFVDNYLTENKDSEMSQAVAAAAVKALGQIGTAFLGGAISGGVMGGTVSAINYAGNQTGRAKTPNLYSGDLSTSEQQQPGQAARMLESMQLGAQDATFDAIARNMQEAQTEQVEPAAAAPQALQSEMLDRAVAEVVGGEPQATQQNTTQPVLPNSVQEEQVPGQTNQASDATGQETVFDAIARGITGKQAAPEAPVAEQGARFLDQMRPVSEGEAAEARYEAQMLRSPEFGDPVSTKNAEKLTALERRLTDTRTAADAAIEAVGKLPDIIKAQMTAVKTDDFAAQMSAYKQAEAALRVLANDPLGAETDPEIARLIKKAAQLMGDLEGELERIEQGSQPGTEKAGRRKPGWNSTATERATYWAQYYKEKSVTLETTLAQLQRTARESAMKMASAESAKRAERWQAAKDRQAIEKIAIDWHNRIAKPTDAKHLPEASREAMAALLEGIQIDLRRGNRDTLKSANWSDSLKNTVAALNRIQTAENAPYMTVDPSVKATLDDLGSRLKGMGKKNLSQMSAQQLQELREAMTSLDRTMKQVDTLHRNKRFESVREAAEASIGELNKIEARRAKTKMDGTMADVSTLDAFSYAQRLGPAAQTVMEGVSDGQSRTFAHNRETVEFKEKLFEQQKVTNADKRAWEKETRPWELSSGERVQVTPAQLMEIVVLGRRAQAAGHMEGGGIALKGKDWKGDETYTKPYQLGAADQMAAERLLTPQQRKVADAMQKFIANEVSGWGNTASMELYGYLKFIDSNYWPIRTDSRFRHTKGAQDTGLFNAVMNAGMTKQTVTGANNPVVIGSIFDTFADHTAQMAAYNGIGAAIEDALKWFNYVQRGEGGEYGQSVKSAIENAYGKKATEYFTNLLTDMQGLAKADSGGIYDRLLTNYKRAAIAGNPRVVVQQPTAIARAMAVIDPKYLGAKPSKGSIAEMQQHSALAWWKANGSGVEIGTGQSLSGVLYGENTALGRATSALMKPAGLADDIAWAQFWNASKAYVNDEYAELQQGTDAYWKAVDAKFSEIITKTQVVDTPMHRPQIMRSKNSLNKLATSFMSEPMKTLNLLNASIRNVKQPGGKQQLVRTTISVATSMLLNSLVKSAWDALRRRDETEKYGEKFAEQFAWNITDEINPLNMVPVIKDLYAILDGDDIDRMDLSALQGFVTATKDMVKYANGTSKKTLYNIIARLVSEGSKVTGVPLAGPLATIEAGLNAIMPGIINELKYGDERYVLERGAGRDESLEKAQARTAMAKASTQQGEKVKLYEDKGGDPRDYQLAYMAIKQVELEGGTTDEKRQAIFDMDIPPELKGPLAVYLGIDSTKRDYTDEETLRVSGMDESTREEVARYLEAGGDRTSYLAAYDRAKATKLDGGGTAEIRKAILEMDIEPELKSMLGRYVAGDERTYDYSSEAALEISSMGESKRTAAAEYVKSGGTEDEFLEIAKYLLEATGTTEEKRDALFDLKIDGLTPAEKSQLGVSLGLDSRPYDYSNRDAYLISSLNESQRKAASDYIAGGGEENEFATIARYMLEMQDASDAEKREKIFDYARPGFTPAEKNDLAKAFGAASRDYDFSTDVNFKISGLSYDSQRKDARQYVDGGGDIDEYLAVKDLFAGMGTVGEKREALFELELPGLTPQEKTSLDSLIIGSGKPKEYSSEAAFQASMNSRGGGSGGSGGYKTEFDELYYTARQAYTKYAEPSGISKEKYTNVYNAATKINATDERTGETVSGLKKARVQTYLKSVPGMTADLYYYLYDRCGYTPDGSFNR